MPAVHFTKETLSFLRDLKSNNKREWFEQNRNRYVEHVQEPAVRFVTDFAAPLARISRHYRADPRTNGGSIFRIYRDTRFSKDKTPYKTHVAIQFRHEESKSAHAPGFYVHLGLDGVFVGVGIWRPDNDSLGRIRTVIAEKPAAWKRVRDNAKLRSHFEPGGDALKRPPAGFAADHPMIEDLKRKDFVAFANLERERATKAGFLDEIAGMFQAGAPLVRYLCGALELSF
jgi:uncharacterized protein (TIGR02453 family)